MSLRKTQGLFYTLTEVNERRKVDLDPLDDIVIQRIFPRTWFENQSNIKYKNPTNPSISVFDWREDLLKGWSLHNWCRNCQFASNKRDILRCRPLPKSFWSEWDASAGEIIQIFYNTNWILFFFWIRNPRSQKLKRFILFCLFPIHNLTDKNLKKGFYNRRFTFLLSGDKVSHALRA